MKEVLLEETVVGNPQLQLCLAGQNPIPLITWIAHTEGIGLTVVEVIPTSGNGTSFLTQNVGNAFNGRNTVTAASGPVPLATVVSSTATVLSGPPAGFPVSQPLPGQQPAAYVQFGS